MQIHEITKSRVDEGLLDLAKKTAGAVGRGVNAVGNLGSRVAQPFRDVGAAYGQSRQTANTAAVAQRALQVWQQYAKNLKAANQDDPKRYDQLYQQSLKAFVEKNLLNGQTVANAVNQREIDNLINQISSVKDNPQQVSGLFNKLVQQSALSMPAVRSANTGGVKIISQDPVVAQFRNRTYILSSEPGKQGEWVDQATGKILDPTWQEYLDNQTGLGRS